MSWLSWFSKEKPAETSEEAPRQSPAFNLVRTLEKRMDNLLPEVKILLQAFRVEIEQTIAAQVRNPDATRAIVSDMAESIKSEFLLPDRKHFELKISALQAQMNERFHTRDGHCLSMDKRLKEIETTLQVTLLEFGYVARYHPEQLIPEQIIPAKVLPAKVTLEKVKESRKR